MWYLIMGIISLYLMSVFLLHLRFNQYEKKYIESNRVLVFTYNDQLKIEWLIRLLFFTSKLKGVELHLILIDEGSTDETMQIIDRLAGSNEMLIRCYKLNPNEY